MHCRSSQGNQNRRDFSSTSKRTNVCHSESYKHLLHSKGNSQAEEGYIQRKLRERELKSEKVLSDVHSADKRKRNRISIFAVLKSENMGLNSIPDAKNIREGLIQVDRFVQEAFEVYFHLDSKVFSMKRYERVSHTVAEA